LEALMDSRRLLLALLEEGYQDKTWHGPNLKQALRGVTAKQASWRPGPGRHNIWEITLHAAYWKYAVRRKLEGGKRGSFEWKGSNFFERPLQGRRNETEWRRDKQVLEREHRALRNAMSGVNLSKTGAKLLRALYGIAFHDVYHAGQIRLLRRLMGHTSGN
jgi:hypothetical protein